MERNAERTKGNILAAAVREFAQNGFFGARVDCIANAAGCNKGMIYQYYGSKEKLYENVIAHEYKLLSSIEAELISKQIPDPGELIDAITDYYFDFLIRNPEFVKIIMWENLNEAKAVKANGSFAELKAPIIDCIRQTVRRGREMGVFNETANSKVVVFALITGAFSYFSNRYTLPCLLNIDLDRQDFLTAHKEIIKSGIRCYLKK